MWQSRRSLPTGGSRDFALSLIPPKQDEEGAFIGRRLTQVECHIDQLVLMVSRG